MLSKSQPWEWMVCIGIVVCLVGILLPVKACACSPATTVRCLSNLKQQSKAVHLYSADWNDNLPPRDQWMDSIGPLVKAKGVFVDTSIKVEGQYGYSFNSPLSQQSLNNFTDADHRPLIFDSINLGRNASDPYISLPKPGRHYGKNNVAYLDGHARSVRNP